MKKEQCLTNDLNGKSLRKKLPTGPGAYLFKDSSGRILYVGKAKNLRNRVLSYFKKEEELTPKTRLMMSRAETLDTILTETENEAFILEDTLVKKHMPRYNVVLRDDKRYPCLRIDVERDYPRLQVVRRMKKDGAVYFGPYSSAGAVRQTLKAIETIFPLRKCRGNSPPRRSRPCLNFQLGRCLGPCTRDVPVETYRELVDQVRLFLDGRSRELLDRLKGQMKEASAALHFERAARIRDRIHAVERTIERQHVVSPSLDDLDVIGVARSGGIFQIVNMNVRKGALAGTRGYLFREIDTSGPEVLEAFVKQYYAGRRLIPGIILVPHPVEDTASIQEWISELAGKRVSIRTPLRGVKKRLLSMAESNARNMLQAHVARLEDPMEKLRAVLHMDEGPSTIESVDISNFQGGEAVGTIVRFKDGAADTKGYKNFRIQGVGGIDDYAMMAETVRRRLSHGGLPDLFLVDGGRGHLSAVNRVFKEEHRGKAPLLLAIAKGDGAPGREGDRIFVSDRKNPLPLGQDHPAVLFLMRVRDETHRRAVTYHRKLRSGGMTRSELDGIPGIGPKRKKALLAHFGSISALKKANLDQIVELPGISRKTAENILQALGGG